jgi:hypothetical protein
LQLRGRTLTLRSAWFIIESEFSSIVGDRWVMDLQREQL